MDFYSYISESIKEDLNCPGIIMEVRELSKQQLKWFLEGLSVDQNPSIKDGK